MRFDWLEKTGMAMDNVPSVYVFFDGKFYIHDLDSTQGAIADPTTLLNFMNKLMHPLLELKSEQEVDSFLDLSREPEETTPLLKKFPAYLGRYYDDKQLKTRALALIFSSDDYD